MNQGQLDFLIQYAEEAVNQAWPVSGETQEQRQTRTQKQESEDASEIAESLSNLAIPREDPTGYHRLKVIRELPQLEWNIQELEAASIPKDRAPRLLAEYDTLKFKSISATINVNGNGEESYIADFAEYERYIMLHCLYDFARQGTNRGAPFSLIEKAAELCAKGIVDIDNRLIAAGEDIIRYEIWRGDEHLKAYFDSHERYYGTKRRRENFRERITAIIDSVRGEGKTGGKEKTHERSHSQAV